MELSPTPQVTVRDIPAWGWLAFGLFLLIAFALGFDQGLADRLIRQVGNNYLHEFFHDGRHLLGFPCH
jgi:hypothetical protein